MSLFISLASGFLEGQVEKQRDEALAIQQDNEATAEKLKIGRGKVADIIASGKGSQEAVDAVVDMYGLDPVRFSNLANLFDSAANSTRVGNVTLPFEIKYGKDEDVLNSVAFMENHLRTNYLAVKDIVDGDENSRKALTGVMGQLWTAENSRFHREESNKGTEGFVSHSYKDWQKANQTAFYNMSKHLGIVPQSTTFNDAPTQLGDTPLSESEVFVPTGSLDGGAEGQIVNVEALGQPYGAKQGMFSSLAKYHGMNQGPNQLWSNGNYLTYGDDEGMTAGEFFNDADKVKTVAYGARLMAVNANDLSLLSGGASKQTLNQVVGVLNEVGGPAEDVNLMRRAMFSITKPEAVYATAPASMKTNITGIQYAESQQYDIKGQRDQAFANDEAVDMLRETVALQQDIGTTGLVSGVEKLVAGISGQITQGAKLFKSQEAPQSGLFQDNLNTDTDTTTSSLLATAESVLGKSRIQKLSRIDSLRLALAAKMARAIDPAGRLSDQDFKIQLERLGGAGVFTTQEGAMENLSVVLREFERRQTEMKFVTDLMIKEDITVEDRRFIKAHHMVSKAMKHKKVMAAEANPMGGTDEPEAPAGPVDVTDRKRFTEPWVATQEDGTEVNVVTDQSSGLNYLEDGTPYNAM